MSFAFTSITTAWFSMVDAVSAAMSAMGTMLMPTLSTVGAATPSEVLSVNWAAPLKSAGAVNCAPSSAALIAAAEPVRVTRLLPLPITETPAVEPSEKLPLLTLTVVVNDGLSTSATLSALPFAAENTSSESSLTACVPGTVWVGASFV